MILILIIILRTEVVIFDLTVVDFKKLRPLMGDFCCIFSGLPEKIKNAKRLIITVGQ